MPALGILFFVLPLQCGCRITDKKHGGAFKGMRVHRRQCGRIEVNGTKSTGALGKLTMHVEACSMAASEHIGGTMGKINVPIILQHPGLPHFMNGQGAQAWPLAHSPFPSYPCLACERQHEDTRSPSGSYALAHSNHARLNHHPCCPIPWIPAFTCAHLQTSWACALLATS